MGLWLTLEWMIFVGYGRMRRCRSERINLPPRNLVNHKLNCMKDGLHFFELDVFVIITCSYTSAEDVFYSNRLHLIGGREDKASYTQFSGDIYPNISCRTTVNATQQFEVVPVFQIRVPS